MENWRGYRRKKISRRGLEKSAESTEIKFLRLSDEMRERRIEQTRERKRKIKNVKYREGVGMRRKRGIGCSERDRMIVRESKKEFP